MIFGINTYTNSKKELKMRLYEIFPDYSKIFKSNHDALMKQAGQTIKTGKVQKKTAEIAKSKENTQKKQAELQKLNTTNESQQRKIK